MRKLLCVTALLVGLGAMWAVHLRLSRPNHRFIFLENSGSREELGGGHPGTTATLSEVAPDWALKAPASSQLELWWFTPRASDLEVEMPLQVIKPEAEPPVGPWHKAFAAEVVARLEDAADKPQEGAGWSPILEAISFLMRRGSQLPGDYDIVLVGVDLLQTSPRFTFTRDYLERHTDDEIARAVAAEFPRPERSPTAVTLYFYPGVTDGEPMTGAYEQRLRGLFTRVLTRCWHVPQVKFETLR